MAFILCTYILKKGIMTKSTKAKSESVTIKEWASSPEGKEALREAIASALKLTNDADNEQKIEHDKARKYFG